MPKDAPRMSSLPESRFSHETQEPGGARQSDPGQVSMIHNNILLSIAIIAIFLIQANAQPGDPLNPGQLGESMSMPLPPELIQDARNAGVITGSNSLYKSDNEQPGFSLMTPAEVAEDNSQDNVNANGTWSFDLAGKIPEKIELYLVQNKDVVTGQGTINRQNETEKATAIGSISGTKMSLTVVPQGVSDLYQLNLSLSSLTAGTYTAYMADGSTRSGQATFAVSANIFKPAATATEDGSRADANADPTASAAATPVWPSGSHEPGSSISSKTSTSMSSSGGWMSESSSSSS